ncbi:phage tail protein [Brachyspira pilosicoli]|nr:phage tail protein [Brachyspira pilosicoli]
MDSNGKFTNGSFNDPKVPASFIPAETMNLILDNLNNLIKAFGLEPNNTSETQLKEAIENKLKNYVCPIGSYYIQPAKPDGTFDDTAAPSKLWEGTVWELLYNTESIFLRTEGSLSEEGRSNGIQGDAIRNITGTSPRIYFRSSGGTGAIKVPSYHVMCASEIGAGGSAFNFDASRVVPTANENRVKNRRIRIYQRIA